jgi:CrcB protein
MRESLAVAIGGALGSVARWGIALALGGASRAFPLSTLTVNVAGSLALGVVLAAWPADRPSVWRLLLGVGFCGGFTTFSTFSGELVALMERGQGARAATYATASLGAGLLAMLAGLAAGRALFGR